MKSIREKAKEAERNTHPLFESISESTGDPVSVYDQNDMIDMFEAGANYVLEEIENVIKSDRILGHPFPSLEMRYNQIISVIEQLKK